MRDLVGAVLLQTFLDLFWGKPASSSVELFECVVRKTNAQVQRQSFDVVYALVIQAGLELFIHRSPPEAGLGRPGGERATDSLGLSLALPPFGAKIDPVIRFERTAS